MKNNETSQDSMNGSVNGSGAKTTASTVEDAALRYLENHLEGIESEDDSIQITGVDEGYEVDDSSGRPLYIPYVNVRYTRNGETKSRKEVGSLTDFMDAYSQPGSNVDAGDEDAPDEQGFADREKDHVYLFSINENVYAFRNGLFASSWITDGDRQGEKFRDFVTFVKGIVGDSATVQAVRGCHTPWSDSAHFLTYLYHMRPGITTLDAMTEMLSSCKMDSESLDTCALNEANPLNDYRREPDDDFSLLRDLSEAGLRNRVARG